MTVTAPSRTLTAREFTSIYDALVTHVKRTRPEMWTDFFQANLGVLLIEMLSAVGDWASFGQDAALLEAFTATCRRYESAIAFARSVGYTPKQASPASASVFATIPSNSPLLVYGGTIQAGLLIVGDNGLPYEFVEAVTLSPSQSSVRATVFEGRSFTETFAVPTGTVNPVLTVSRGDVAQDSWEVFVGDATDPANRWVQVASVALETTASQTYEVLFDVDSKLIIRFGDGVYGAIPTQTPSVNYRTCSGSLGNTPVQTIRGTVKVSVNLPGTGTASIDFVNYDPTPATEGSVASQADEAGTAVGNSASLAVQLAHAPLKPGAVRVMIPFQSGGGGQLVLQDDSLGNMLVSSSTTAIPDVTNPPSNLLGVLAAYVNYQTGLVSVQFTSAVPVPNAGGIPISDYDYFSSLDPSAALVQGAAVGGAGRDTLEKMRTAIPSYVKSQDRIITLDDYDQGLLRVVSVALAKTDARPLAYVGNVIRLNVWSDETITFNSVLYNGALGSAKYRRYSTSPAIVANNVQQYLKSRTLVTAHHVIQRPGMLWVDLYLRDVFYDPRTDAQSVRDGIVEAVTGVFQSASGFAIRLSEVYAAIYRVSGVSHFTLQRAAVGTRASSGAGEQVAVTSAATSVVATLLEAGTSDGAIAVPGSIRIVLEQGVDRLIVNDDGNGSFIQVAGSNALVIGSSTINYVTGSFVLTFTSALTGGQIVSATYDNVSADYRQNQKLTRDSLEDGDYWPQPGAVQIAPVNTAAQQYDGRALTSVGATAIEYDGLQDIVIESANVDLRFFDDTYLFDNTSYYDSELRFNNDMRSINLRKLDFRVTPRT